MIYLEFLEGQGLGNQLWNYVSLRSICKYLNYKYQVINPEKFKGKNFLDIDMHNLNKAKNKVIDPNIFSEKIYYDNQLNNFSCDFDPEILNIKSNTKIKGLFQSEKYLFDFDINNFIKLKNYNSLMNERNNNLCIINIRGGEYKRFKELILPKSYWLNAIENMKKYNKKLDFAIITDDYDYASRLLPEYNIIKGNIDEDFKRIYVAKYVIASNSSFAYFPITLGNKPLKVIAPAHWSRFNNKYKRWISPANFYSGWKYQNQKGEIISYKEIRNYLDKTRNVYYRYNILTNRSSFKNKNLLSIFPKRIKNFIKFILSKIFPMIIG
tara:strand:+ start:3180 stop:4151 length:972 start_codon:yes stop_codon:yes gene_type:complete